MERLLHYVWKYKLYTATPLITTEGRPVQVIDPGMQNTDAGPDFFNAKIKIRRNAMGRKCRKFMINLPTGCSIIMIRIRHTTV